MKLTSKHIRGLPKQAWPDLNKIWLTDPQYEAMPWDWLTKVIDECVLKMTFKKDVWDCNNYALQFHAMVQMYQYKLIESGELNSKHSWALGECIGFNEDAFFGTGIHAQNLAITDKRGSLN